MFDPTDGSTFAGGRALVARAVDEFGTVDALALLAGRIPLSPLADVSEDEWDGVVTSHLKGHFSLIQAAAPVMKEKRYGRIVGFASVQGTIGDSHQTPYCAAKAGIVGLMRAVTIELDPFGICANTVCPAGVDGVFGPIATRLGRPISQRGAASGLSGQRAGGLAQWPRLRHLRIGQARPLPADGARASHRAAGRIRRRRHRRCGGAAIRADVLARTAAAAAAAPACR